MGARNFGASNPLEREEREGKLAILFPMQAVEVAPPSPSPPPPPHPPIEEKKRCSMCEYVSMCGQVGEPKEKERLVSELPQWLFK